MCMFNIWMKHLCKMNMSFANSHVFFFRRAGILVLHVEDYLPVSDYRRLRPPEPQFLFSLPLRVHSGGDGWNAWGTS